METFLSESLTNNLIVDFITVSNVDVNIMYKASEILTNIHRLTILYFICVLIPDIVA